MLTGPYCYSFDTKSKPGSMVIQAIRFETIELPMQGFKETEFKILCDHHAELKKLPLSALKHTVATNFPTVK